MVPSESHDLAELVADLARLVDVVAPPHRLDPLGDRTVDAALDEFLGGWAVENPNAAPLPELGMRVAAAGMALVEGDPQTVRRLMGVRAGAA